jgi:outer membrane protein OmpA-like peptidoglycan-associated protein
MSKAFRLGIFTVGSLLVFGAGIFWIGSRDFRFTRTYRLYADFQNVAGLGNGATVRVGGIHQGSVRRILLPKRPDQKVRVEMDLRESTRNVIRKDSVATIRTEGLVGDQFVEITFGSPDGQGVRDGETIRAEQPIQIADMLKKTNAILDSAQGAVQSIDQTAGNMEAISAKVNSGKGTAGALVNDRSVYEQINQATANLQDDTEALKHNFFLRGFFRKRGYENSADLSRNAITRLPTATPEKRLSYSGAKLFKKADSAKLKNGKLLDDLGRLLEQNPHGLAVIASYGGRLGDSDKELQLTQARAAVVRDYLAQHFRLDDKHIKTFAVGKTAQAAEGGEVQVAIYPAGTLVTTDTRKK